MGEDAFRLQSRQGAGGGDGFHACVKVPLPHQETQPGHAGVHLDVDLQCAAALYASALARADTAWVMPYSISWGTMAGGVWPRIRMGA